MAIAAGAAGAFASLDLFFFYAFHELALIPTFLMIGIWGTGNKQAAAWKITIYLSIGSIILLVGLIGLYLLVPEKDRTFDIVKLQAMASHGVFAGQGAYWIFFLLLLGFGTLVSSTKISCEPIGFHSLTRDLLKQALWMIRDPVVPGGCPL